MPASTRRQLAATRAHHTGETHHHAALGTGRHTHGLDDCTPAQRLMRSRLALRLLHRHRGLDRILDVEVVASPRHDRLVLFAVMDDYVGRQFMCGDIDWQVSHTDPHAITFLDPASGGVLELRTGKRIDPCSWSQIEDMADQRHRRGPDLDPCPEAASPDAQALHAALVARLNLGPGRVFKGSRQAKDMAWCMSWGYDPATPAHSYGKSLLVLDGEGDEWTLAWDSHPHPATVLAALAHPVLGVAGLDIGDGLVRGADDTLRATLRLGSARLQLVWYEHGAPRDLVLDAYLTPARLARRLARATGQPLDRNQGER